MIEVHAEFPQREVIQANAVVDNEEKTVSEVIISAKPEITGVTASVDNETGTPYVDVTETGTGTDFSFDLAFHNLKGDRGEQGLPGQDGQDGQDGISPTAEVTQTAEGATITVTDVSGTTSANILNGTDGQDGADGQAATITVGTTTTGAAGTNASVVNSGTSSAAIFDFTIPRGDKGDTGNTGATGNGIVNTEYISSSGLVDTYHVNYTNGDYDTFTVTNGRDGSGSVTDVQINGTSILTSGVANFLTNTAYNPSTNKIATMNDLPSGGANTDLSNLTATGEAHFQEPLVSGTNIKTINSTSLLGSGNIAVQSVISDLSDIRLNASDGARIYSQISNAGDIITGSSSLKVQMFDGSSFANYQLLDGATGLIPDARISSNIQRTLVSGTNIKTINNASILGSGNLNVGKNIGEIVTSTIPLTDAGLHLLDGTLLQYGSYQAFIDYILGLVSDYPNLFCTEADWQTSVTTYGSCGKFVYDSVNNTVRLPKRPTTHGNLIESQDGSTWYRIYEDGWCEQGGVGTTTATITFPKEFTDTNYYFNAIKYGTDDANATEFNSLNKTTATIQLVCAYNGNDLDRDFMWEAKGYLAFSNYKQQTLYEYIVLANSTKTDIEVDIDEIATDLNGKADKDLQNINSNIASIPPTSLLNFDGQWTWKYLGVATNTAVNSYTHSLASYLPDSTYDYMILGRVAAEYSASTAGLVVGTVASPSTNETDSGNFCMRIQVSQNSRASQSSFILPIKSTDQNLYSQIASNKLGASTIRLYGYRRIGTNT